MTRPDKPRTTGAFWVSIASLISARGVLGLSQILILPIIARQLEVEDFALMALAMTIVIFATVLSDAGLGRSLIRRREFDQLEWSSVFWMMVTIGAALMAATIALAPLVAWFFDAPRLIGLLAALSVVPLFQSIAAAHNAEIERRENYAGIARVQVIATAISFCVAVILAFAGAGVWALVAQQIGQAFVRLVCIVRLSAFRARFEFSKSMLSTHFVFARDTLLISLLVVLRQQMTVIAIGRVLGPTPLGYFAMSQRFTRLPQFGLAGPVSSVVFVRMSKAQDDLARLSEIYIASMRLLAVALIQPMAMLAVAGVPIFTLFLSHEWADVAPLFALSIGGLVIEAIALFCLSCLFRALSRTDQLVRLTFEGLLVQTALMGSVFLGVHAVALSLTIWGLILVPRGWFLARRLIPLDLQECIGTLVPGLAAAAITSVIYLYLSAAFAFGNAECVALAVFLGALGLALHVAFDIKGIRAAIAVFRVDATYETAAPVTVAIK